MPSPANPGGSSTQAPSMPSPLQPVGFGNSGGTGVGPDRVAGGGGGAGGAGSGGSGNPHGGPGGNGKSVTPVFGSSPQPFYGPTNGTYAGGGGGTDCGTNPSGGSGGPGGGGAGAAPNKEVLQEWQGQQILVVAVVVALLVILHL